MTYTLSFQEEDGYLKVTVEGSRAHVDPAKSGQRVVDQILNRCRESHYSRVMLVSHLTGSYPPFANYQVVTSLEQFGVPKEWKLAYVNLDEPSQKSVLFSETLARNKGYQACVFQREQDAHHWLIGDSPGD
ncbi:MAG: hypothetical protein OQL20_00220 [Sedimenticola sp.]|nr:hypothetical protein [Sedimenticola sp.]